MKLIEDGLFTSSVKYRLYAGGKCQQLKRLQDDMAKVQLHINITFTQYQWCAHGALYNCQQYFNCITAQSTLYSQNLLAAVVMTSQHALAKLLLNYLPS